MNITRISNFNKRIKLQSPTLTQSSSGQTTKSWSTYATVWAGIRTLSGNEKSRNQMVIGIESMEVSIRYSSDVSAVSVADRIVLGSRYFDIKDVRNVDEKNIEIRMIVTEIKE